MSEDVRKEFQQCKVGEKVVLPAPNYELKVPLMEAIMNRKSRREFTEDPIAKETIADIFWVGNGYNRRAEFGRTSPTAKNQQDIVAYAITKEGAFLYLPDEMALLKLTDKDLRKDMDGIQTFPDTAPLTILFTAKKVDFPEQMAQVLNAFDAGHASQDVLLYCAAANLACVPRIQMSSDALVKDLKLPPDERPVMNIVIGHMKHPDIPK